ncbi:MAG: hypothetical protein WC444_04330 [Candidatus Paceibacterota bacterium]
MKGLKIETIGRQENPRTVGSTFLKICGVQIGGVRELQYTVDARDLKPKMVLVFEFEPIIPSESGKDFMSVVEDLRYICNADILTPTQWILIEHGQVIVNQKPEQ